MQESDHSRSRPAGPPKGAEAEIDEQNNHLEYLLDLSVRYHDSQAGAYGRLNKFIALLSAIAGAGTFTGLVAEWSPLTVRLLAAAVAFFSAIDLVIDSSGRARKHMVLKRRFLELQRQRVLLPATDEALRRWNAEKLEVDADEPPKLRVLAAMIHNQIVRKRGLEAEYLVPLNWLQRLCAPLVDIGASKIRRRMDEA